MKTRKLILIIADIILLSVVIIQGILKTRDGAKYFELKQEPDCITIQTPSETISLVLENDNWFIGDKKYPADKNSVQNLVDALSYIRALDKVASVNENSSIKYELVDGKKISVTASKEGKTIRSLEIGKEATANSHAYITVDGGKDIFVASGTLKSIFDKSTETLRSKSVWNFEQSDISSAAITFADGKSWTASRIGSGENISWNITGSETENVEMDSEKISQMLNSLANVNAVSWYDDNATISSLGGDLLLSAKVGASDKNVSIEIYEIKPSQEALAENSDSDVKPESVFYAKSSETPYIFRVASYVVDKFNKKPQDIAK